MVAPRKLKVKKVRKAGEFVRFHSNRFLRVKPAWRKPRGIDNPARRQFRGNRPLVRIGYGSDKRTKLVRPNGFKTFLVHNLKELEVLMMANKVYAAEIAHSVSQKSRKILIERAHQLDIKVTNEYARLKREENE
eukprot:Phypoly_transcript_25824.p1 GENE.Phypoly_transcript_25824~~Phypoly_transcript_25824.p1  ORF type:complete len:134 (+),score=13.37 Phypoly_transcript_25824:97-498(+)